MSLQEEFKAAQGSVKNLASTPTSDELLTLYALYKQATEGDAHGKRPGMLDVKGRFKYDAWTKQKGTSRDHAMQQYNEMVARLTKHYGKSAT